MKLHHWLPALLLASLTAACGGGEDRCLTNETQTCIGPGGCDGVQTCVDGDSFTVCECFDAQTDGGTTDAGTTDGGSNNGETDGGQTDGGEVTQQAPRIISLTANLTTMEPDGQLTISAIVTDPDGIDDLIGGRLEHPGGGTYGTFATAAQEGAYTLTLTWDQINAVAPLEAGPEGSQRVFQARFYDVAGNEATDELTITMRCKGGLSACAGTCTDLEHTLDSCGACGFSCEDDTGLEAECPAGECGHACVDGSCRLQRTFWGYDPGSFYTCDTLCANIGFECLSVQWSGWCCESSCPAETCDAVPAAADECYMEFVDCACEAWVTAP